MSDIKNKKSLELKIYIFIVTKALKAFACPMFVNIFILRPFFFYDILHFHYLKRLQKMLLINQRFEAVTKYVF